MTKAIREFKPVEHRLEFVAKVGGASYYNDTIATTPERTLAALASFEERIVLLIGGREKHLPLEDFAERAVARCSAIICFGESAALFEEALASAAGEADLDLPIERAEVAGRRRGDCSRSRAAGRRRPAVARLRELRRVRQLRGARRPLPRPGVESFREKRPNSRGR